MTFIRAEICSTGHLDGITFSPLAGASDISVRLGNWAAYCMDWFEAYEHGIIAQFAPEARAKIEIRTER